ncbi:MAG: FecR domain-containing protein, partial [Verrucomicrobia bacterium]|nr:FecR domain-containing protein [Verrucomicrobiota bacterium]
MKNAKEERAIENELFELCEKTLNDELSIGDLERLEALVVEHCWARKLYVEYMHQHAGLYWQHTNDSEAFSLASLVSEISDEDLSESTNLSASESGRSKNRVISGPWRWRKLAAAAAVLAGGVILGLSVSRRDSDAPIVATLIKASNCSWRSGALPTEEGAELRAGRLRLQEGLARLKFVSGAEVTLEAPVDIDLISPMLCRLYRGTVVAKVPEQAIGFTIETDTAKLVDLGTEFGVHVGGEGTNILVFDGMVDVEQRASGKVQRLTTGNGSKVSKDAFETTESASLELVSGASMVARQRKLATGKAIVITTAKGRGGDAYIQATDSDM